MEFTVAAEIKFSTGKSIQKWAVIQYISYHKVMYNINLPYWDIMAQNIKFGTQMFQLNFHSNDWI